MNAELQTVFAGLSLAASLLLYVVSQQTRSAVIEMKVEMLDRLTHWQKENDQRYLPREMYDSIEKRINKLEDRHAGNLQR